jgi:hypothetical protein
MCILYCIISGVKFVVFGTKAVLQGKCGVLSFDCCIIKYNGVLCRYFRGINVFCVVVLSYCRIFLWCLRVIVVQSYRCIVASSHCRIVHRLIIASLRLHVLLSAHRVIALCAVASQVVASSCIVASPDLRAVLASFVVLSHCRVKHGVAYIVV